MSIVTEEMHVRKKMCEYALKYGVSKAARRYNTYRQFVYRQLDKYDGTVESLAFKSRKPKTVHPNQHTEEEIQLVKKKYQRFSHEGLAKVYVQLKRAGYTRSFNGMKRVIKKYIKKKNRKRENGKRTTKDPNKRKPT